MSSVIHQEVAFSARPERVYEVLIDSTQFAEVTGAPAEIGRDAGDSFSCFGGMVTGRHVELLAG